MRYVMNCVELKCLRLLYLILMENIQRKIHSEKNDRYTRRLIM